MKKNTLQFLLLLVVLILEVVVSKKAHITKNYNSFQINKNYKVHLRIRKNVNETSQPTTYSNHTQTTTLSTSEPSPESTSEPSPESESEPSPESGSEPSPESESNPENHDTSVPEDEVTAESEPEPQPETWPEPGPEWEKAYKLWRNAWPAHTYLFSTIFLLMAFYSGFYVVVNIKDGLGNKYLSISLNVMMCVLCTTRSFVLFVDPYHQGTLIADKLVLQLMWSIGTPCLLASDSLCILALAESANVTLTQQRFQRLSNILIVIFLHFALVIATDIVVSSHSSAKVMILYCQVFSIIWGILLGFWYFTLAHKINHVLFKGAGRRKSRGDRIYILLIYLSSAANIFTCVLMLYSAVGVFGIYSDVEFVDAWPWYAMQSGMRTSEVIAAVLVFTVSAKRNRIKNKVHNVVVCGQSQDTKETSDTSGSIPTVDNLHPVSRNRRMSMFSAVHQSKITAQVNVGNDTKPDSLSQLQPASKFVSGNKNNPSSRGRRMSLFSQLHESKLSVTQVKVKPQRDHNEFLPTDDTGKRSGGGRRMSMFSQLQELKMSSANVNSSIPSVLESEKGNTNVKISGIFSGLQHLVESRKKANKSNEPGQSSQHSNLFSKYFRGKVEPVSSTPAKCGRKLGKITALCQSVHTVSTKERKNDDTDVNGNDMPSSHENKTVEHVIDMPGRHDHLTNTRNAFENMRGMHVNDMSNARGSRKDIELRRSNGSRTSLFAGLRETNSKLEGMKIIEDDEEEVEEQKILVAQDAQVLSHRESSSRNSDESTSIC